MYHYVVKSSVCTALGSVQVLIQVDKWDYIFQKPPTGSFFLFYILIFIYFFKYETIVRSSAWSFGHSDPDPSSVIYFGKAADLSLYQELTVRK